MKELTLEVIEVNSEVVGKCWMWNGYCNTRGGYPRAWIDGQGFVSVRSFVFKELMGKRLGSGYVVSTRCGNIACVSPKCVVARSHGQVIAKSYQTGARVVTKEQQRRNAKLTMQIARAIRASVEPSSVLAARFGVHKATINCIRSGARWAEPKPVRHSSIFNLAGSFAQEAA